MANFIPGAESVESRLGGGRDCRDRHLPEAAAPTSLTRRGCALCGIAFAILIRRATLSSFTASVPSTSCGRSSVTETCSCWTPPWLCLEDSRRCHAPSAASASATDHRAQENPLARHLRLGRHRGPALQCSSRR